MEVNRMEFGEVKNNLLNDQDLVKALEKLLKDYKKDKARVILDVKNYVRCIHTVSTSEGYGKDKKTIQELIADNFYEVLEIYPYNNGVVVINEQGNVKGYQASDFWLK